MEAASQDRVALVSKFDEVAARACRDLNRFDLFHSAGEFQLTGGLLAIPVNLEYLGKTSHFPFKVVDDKITGKWHSLSGWRRRRLDFNGIDGHERAQEFYGADWGNALIFHLHALLQPHVKTVTVPLGMEMYWAEASLVEAKAMELMETSTDTGLDVIDRLSSLNALGAELRISLETMDNRGMILDEKAAPELHKIYHDRSRVLRGLLSDLVLELQEAKRYLVDDLTSLASSRWSAV